MAKVFYLSEVCEQLAGDLVREQATLLKQEAIVREIKAKLVEGKQQLIKKLIVGKDFYLEGHKMTALFVTFDEKVDTMRVVVTMGLSSEQCIHPYALTKKEKLLISDYKALCEFCREEGDEYFGREAHNTADELSHLKNDIRLIWSYCWDVNFSNATTPGFFEESGLTVHEAGGKYLLEDMKAFSI